VTVANPLTSIFAGGISDILGKARDIIGEFHASPEQTAAANEKLAELAQQVTLTVLASERDLAVQQASVIRAEAQSESWLARNWRPILMLVFTYIIAHDFVFAPMFHLQSVPIPPDMWELLKLGIGGYIIGRSAEKIVPATAAAVVAAKTPALALVP
jgi:hypothetical protein